MGSPVKRWVQVVNLGGSHWITLSNMCTKRANAVQVYDSGFGYNLSDSMVKIICTLSFNFLSEHDHLIVETADCQRQRGGSDCGLFALAFATELCHGVDPICRKFTQQDMRIHLSTSYHQGCLLPFPSTSRRTPFPPTRKVREIEIFCLCRNLANGIMVQCDSCQKWFHRECVKVPEPSVLSEKKTFKFHCPTCSTPP